METLLNIIYFLFIIVGILFVGWRFRKQGLGRSRLLIVGLILGVAMTYLVPMILANFEFQDLIASSVRYVAYLSPGAWLSAFIGFLYGYNVGQSPIPFTLMLTLGKLVPVFNAIAYAIVLDVVGVLYHRLPKKF